MIVTINMNSGEDWQIQLDDSVTNRKSKLEELKRAMINGDTFDADDGTVLNGKFIESFTIQTLGDEDLD